jgi:hypothetical protein
MDYYNKKAMVVLMSMVMVTPFLKTLTALAQYIPEPNGSVQLRPLSDQEGARVYLIQRVGVKEYRQWNRVISAESDWEQGAINERTGDYCLAQINEDSWDIVAQKLGLDYKNNYKDCLELALVIKKEMGWSAWNSSKHRWSKRS